MPTCDVQRKKGKFACDETSVTREEKWEVEGWRERRKEGEEGEEGKREEGRDASNEWLEG